MSAPILKYFEYAHLPEKLQQVSKPVGELARHMDATLPDSAEKSAGLRKLLEAKDCLLRAAIDLDDSRADRTAPLSVLCREAVGLDPHAPVTQFMIGGLRHSADTPEKQRALDLLSAEYEGCNIDAPGFALTAMRPRG